MKLIPRGGTWQVHFTDSDGNRQRTSTKVKVDPRLPDKGKAMANLKALDIMRDNLMNLSDPEVRREAGKALTLGYALQHALDHRWRGQKSGREKHYVVRKLIREIGYWPLKSITYTRLSDYGKELEVAGDTPATRNRKMSAIHTAMTEARKRGEIEALPDFPHWAENNIKERYLTPGEEKALLASMAGNAAPADAEAQYMLHMVPFLLDTGLRAGEAIVDADQDRGDAVWLRHGTTKSGRGRTVPLTARARAALTALLASPVHTRLQARRAESKDKPTAWMGARFRAATEKAGIKGVTLHTLRHTCASRLVQAGVSLYVVKEWLGHSSITITERYAHLAPTNLAAAMAMLENTAPALPVPPNDTPQGPRATVH